MKTLKDVQEYCLVEIEINTDDILQNINPYDILNENILSGLKGRIEAYSDINATIRNALEHHECQCLDEGCVICGERKE